MFQVSAALLPGIAALAWQFGPGVLVQIPIALGAALAAEAAVLWLRRRPAMPALADGSAVLTALLLAVSVPPLLPWWATAFGALFAIVIGKQLYGGLGYNPFNPAMVGYAALLISFPRPMTAWLPPLDLAATPLGFADALAWIFHPPGPVFDGLAQATPLDTLKTQLGLQTHLDEIQSAGIFGGLSGRGWQWVNAGFLAGGVWLLRRGLADWRIPAGFLGSLFGLALFFFLYDPAVYPTPLFHVFSGAAMLGAFFISTDPVSASTTPKGRWIYGAAIGGLVFVIRSGGGYPDGVAFAVLLLNLAAPAIDHFTRPRVYGHSL
jgi:electron transport complex protein RnfD